jgi:MATE family multidrug resistance protein
MASTFKCKAMIAKTLNYNLHIVLYLPIMKNEISNTLILAIPLMIGNLTQVAYSLIDTAMIGVLGYKELAAASLTANIVAIPQIMGMGLMMAITPLIAIANAQNLPQKATHVLFNGWALSIVAGILLAITVHLTAYFLTDMGQDIEVAQLAKNYLIIMGYSLIPMMLFIASKHFSDGLHFTKTAMILSILSLPLNAFLCWLFIYGHWGVTAMGINGAGVATFLTRTILALAMMAVLMRHKIFSIYMQHKKEHWYLGKKTFTEILRLGIPGSLQYCMEAGAFSVSGIMVGWLGAVQQAAHQVALNCASATFMIALGFSLAGSIRVSTAYGKKDAALLFAIGKSTVAGGLAFGLLAAIILIATGSYLPYIFSNNRLVISSATTLLIFAAIFQVSDATQAIGVGLCRGVKDVVRPTIYIAIAYWLIGIPTGYVLAFHYQFGAVGIWIGLVTGLTVSSFLLNIRYFNNVKNLTVTWKGNL